MTKFIVLNFTTPGSKKIQTGAFPVDSIKSVLMAGPMARIFFDDGEIIYTESWREVINKLDIV